MINIESRDLRCVQIEEQTPAVKCVVWDLDDTLWEGILADGYALTLRAGIEDAIKELDSRGVLQSIASKNDYEPAMDKLRSFGIADYFLYPQIGWGDKSAAVRSIADKLGIGRAAMIFVDDQAFERDEVQNLYPEVRTWEAGLIDRLLQRPEMQPRFITEESRHRRLMYLVDADRNAAESVYPGTRQEFLRTLNMQVFIREASEDDLRRAEELTVRTNQLNTTGRAYSYEELLQRTSVAGERLLVVELRDKYGSSGVVGLALVSDESDLWMLRLFIMSCRVVSRGVGSMFLSFIRQSAHAAGCRLQVEFLPNDRNRMMDVTLAMNGFREVARGERAGVILQDERSFIAPYPPYAQVHVDKSVSAGARTGRPR